eukprot:5870829-Pyramimonas_sp.AAC.1
MGTMRRALGARAAANSRQELLAGSVASDGHHGRELTRRAESSGSLRQRLHIRLRAPKARI